MKKSTYLLFAIGLLVTVIASACGTPATTPQAAPPAPASVATEPPAAPATQAPAAQPAAPAFAPACAAAASCAAPTVVDTEANSTYCVKKVPWQNILAPAGTIFEPQPKAEDPKFYPLVCTDQGTQVNGQEVFGCHGAELWQYELKVTSPSCGASNLQAGTTSCADGQGFDAANNCCAPITSGDSGSVIIKVNMGACPTK